MLKKASLLVPVLAGLLAASACSAGRHNPQFQTEAAQDTVSATVGGNAIRNAYIVAPVAKGGTARASVFLARLDPGTDRLISASSPIAGSAALLLAGQPVQDVALTATNAPTIAIDLSGVTKDVDATSSYPLTLTFAQAGEVTLQVPVLRPGIVAPGTTTLPKVIPEHPVGSVVPLDARSEVPNTPED